MTLTLDGMPVAVETAGPSRKARLTVEADGSLAMRAAEDVTEEELQSFLTSRRRWVYDKLAIKEALAAEAVVKELVTGEGLAYLGRNYRLQVVGDGDSVTLQQGRLSLPERLIRQSTGRAAIVAWYSTRGEAWLRPRAEAWAERLRVAPKKVEVTDLGHKWGSNTPDGRIRIHWATLQLVPRLVEYVLLHELAHLREPNHGQAFWETVVRAMPDAHPRKDELARIGATLWLGAVAEPRRTPA
ncbi:MAG: M48 family metallopeptidase [Propionibacteriaceae bacterium]|jgi:predicted metal-dependent hydrolase|nr:M48 family metallopeptidase [Propionibacteriaceae bacterium]